MIQTRDLTVRVGEFNLRAVNLSAAAGEYFVLLGPPGSGKTVLLETLCGLHRPRSGSVHIASREVTALDPALRNIGYVPQEYALFPTLSVRENVLFGLRARGVSTVVRSRRLEFVVSLLGIGPLLDRRTPEGLSGGERQRVALARALAVEPQVLLLDEPVSALDEVSRERLCIELKRIQTRLGTTTIHVSHNFEETLTVADRVGVLRHGELVQTDTPGNLLSHPADVTTARFVRMDNIFPARAQNGSLTLLEVTLTWPGLTPGTRHVGVRPENIELVPRGSALPAGSAGLPTTVTDVWDRGPLLRLLLTTPNGSELVCLATKAHVTSLGLKKGSFTVAVLRPDALHLFDSAPGARII